MVHFISCMDSDILMLALKNQMYQSFHVLISVLIKFYWQTLHFVNFSHEMKIVILPFRHVTYESTAHSIYHEVPLGFTTIQRIRVRRWHHYTVYLIWYCPVYWYPVE